MDEGWIIGRREALKWEKGRKQVWGRRLAGFKMCLHLH